MIFYSSNSVYITKDLASVIVRMAILEKGLVNSIIEAINELGIKLGAGYIKSVRLSVVGDRIAHVRILLAGIVFSGEYNYDHESLVKLKRVTLFDHIKGQA